MWLHDPEQRHHVISAHEQGVNFTDANTSGRFNSLGHNSLVPG